MAHDLMIQKNNLSIADSQKKQFLTINLAGHLLGIPINCIRDVLAPQNVTAIPLSPKEVTGSLNLRGRIVTEIDLRVILNLDTDLDLKTHMGVVVEHNNDLYSFVVESVGEVLNLSNHDFINNPTNLAKNWRDLSLGVCPLKGQLLIIIDIAKLLSNLTP